MLFVPGFRQDITSLDYRGTIKAIEEKGYEVKFVPIHWSRTVLSDWVKELEAEYAKHDSRDTILAGFSFGSLTAMVAASHRGPAELWLFSFSPYFADDIPKMKKSWLKNQGSRRIAEFNKLNLEDYTNMAVPKILIFLGGAEAEKYPLVNRRSILAKKYFKNSKLIRIEDVGHDVGNPRYIAAIKQNID